MSVQHTFEQPQQHNQTPQASCGSIIDAEGREVPITEQMIQQACERLERSRVERQ